MAEPEFVIVGRVVKPHGIKGELAVQVLSDVPGRLDPGVIVRVGGTAHRIEAVRPHQGRLLVTFEGVHDRTAAELLRGGQLEAEAIPLDQEDSDTFYVGELLGTRVVGPDGETLGAVTDVIEVSPAAGYELLEVRRPDGSKWLLPAADALVEAVETDDGQLELRLIDPPDGLER